MVVISPGSFTLLFCVILTPRSDYYFHFIDEGIEAQRDIEACPSPVSLFLELVLLLLYICVVIAQKQPFACKQMGLAVFR